MSTLKDNKKMFYIALSKHLFAKRRDNLSKMKSKLLDTAEKNNLKKHIHMLGHYQFSSVIRYSGIISSLPEDKPQVNHALQNIIINSYVEGYWKWKDTGNTSPNALISNKTVCNPSNKCN
jgi:hypothetical protein